MAQQQPSVYPNINQQPPQYTAPPPAGFAQPAGFAPQPGATIVVTDPGLGQDPKQVTCPACHSTVITETSPTPGLLTYLLSGLCCLVG